MITIGLFGLSVVLLLTALRTKPRGAVPRLYLAVSLLPLLLTMVVPVPFALVARSPTDWARQTVAAVSRIGITLSFILLTIGAFLTLRAVLAGDQRVAKLLALETVLAGLPAVLVTAYAAAFR